MHKYTKIAERMGRQERSSKEDALSLKIHFSHKKGFKGNEAFDVVE